MPNFRLLCKGELGELVTNQLPFVNIDILSICNSCKMYSSCSVWALQWSFVEFKKTHLSNYIVLAYDAPWAVDIYYLSHSFYKYICPGLITNITTLELQENLRLFKKILKELTFYYFLSLACTPAEIPQKNDM